MNVSQALEDVAVERTEQDVRWGVQRHEPPRWLAILAEEFGEAAKEVTEAAFASTVRKRASAVAKMRAELIQVAAVAVAFAECLDRGDFKWRDVA